MLPGKDGFTVATELRKASNYIPMLMLTARSRPEDVLKGFASGADDYLPKPFDLANPAGPHPQPVAPPRLGTHAAHRSSGRGTRS